MNEETAKITLRTTKSLSDSMDKAAASEGLSKNELLIKAFKYYQNYTFAKNKASFINDNILDMVHALVDKMEMRINHRTNQLLSELCIEQSVLAQVLAEAYDIPGDSLAEKRKNAVEFLKTNQRVLRLDEVIE